MCNYELRDLLLELTTDGWKAKRWCRGEVGRLYGRGEIQLGIRVAASGMW